MTRASTRLRALSILSLLFLVVLPAVADAALLEILDPYGRPTTVVSNELRLRVTEPSPGGPGTPPPYLIFLGNEATLDDEQIPLTEISPGVFESAAVPVVDEPMSRFDGRLSSPVGSSVLMRYTGFYYPTNETASATVGAGLELTDAGFHLTESFLLGEPVGVELRFLGADVSPGPDLASVSLSTGLAGDAETLHLIETAPRSGLFRGVIQTAFSPGAAAPYSGILEQTFAANGGSPLYDSIHVAYAGSDPAVADQAAISAAARVELIDAIGRPATTFGSGEKARLRVKDLTAASSSVSAYASCGSSSDFENLLLSDLAGGTRIFEAEVTVSIGDAIAGNRQLECPAEGPLHFSYVDATGTSTLAVASLTEGSISFLDEAGLPTAEVLDGRRTTVRVTAPGSNLQPAAFDTVTATVASRNTLDSESFVLRETGVASGIFEGTVRISSRPTGEPQVDVVYGGPSGARDEVTATFGAAAAAAEILVARLGLYDLAGRELEAVLPESVFEVRVEMPVYGDPYSPDYLSPELRLPNMTTWVSLYETALDSRIYSGQVQLSHYPVTPGQVIGIYLPQPAGILKQVPVVGSLVRFVGPAGESLDSLPVNRPLTVELKRSQNLHDPFQLEQVEVKLRSEYGGDLETLVLAETDSSSGIFRGSLPLRLGAAAPGDAVLQAWSSTPFGDIVRVEPADSQELLASAGLRLPRVRLLDAEGRETSRLVRGQRYEIEVEDSAFDLYAGVAEGISVELLAISGLSSQPLGSAALQENGLATGVFRGGLMVVSQPGPCRHGVTCVELAAGGELTARHQLAGNLGEVDTTAVVAIQSIELVDAQGRAVQEVLEGAPIHIRLIDSNQQPAILEWRSVMVASRLGGEIETVEVWETSAGSGIFERTLATRLLPVGAGGQSGDGVLILGTDFRPGLVTGEAVLLHYAPPGGPAIDAAVPTIGARFAVLDDGGQPATAIGGTTPVTLRLEFPALAADGQQANFEIASTSGDSEYFFVSATGGIYTVEVPFYMPAGWWDIYSGDGRVALNYGGQVVFTHRLWGPHSGEMRVTLPVGAPMLRFLDPVTGVQLTNAPDLRPFKVQLLELESSPSSIETREITLRSWLTGDAEPVQLVETDYGTAIYEAIVTPRIAASSPAQPGVLEVSRRAGGVYDVVTAHFQSYWSEPRTASLQLSGPRVLWTDAAGSPVEEITVGRTAHVLVDDPLANADPAQADILPGLVSEGPNGFENLLLEETGPDTGIFRGSLPVTAGERVPYDGVLQALPRSFEHFRYSMGTLFGSILAEVRVRSAELFFVGGDGEVATSYALGESVRLRLYDADPSRSPTLADRVEVRLGSIPLGLDDEILELVETSGDSGVFEGAMATAPAPAVAGNGILEIGRGAGFDSAIALYGDSSTQAAFTSANRLRLIDLLGREISRLSTGYQKLGVEVASPAGGDPETVDTLPGTALVEHSGHPLAYDAENLTLVETGPATGVFRAFLQTGWGSAGPGDGFLNVDAYYAGTVKAGYGEGADRVEASLAIFNDQPPQAGDDYAPPVSAGSSITLAVLANDIDPEGTQLLLGAAASSANVSASVNPDGTLTLAVAPGASGYEMLTYLVSDQAGSISEGRVFVYLVSPPVLTILGPENGTVMAEQGGYVEISASAFDQQDGDLGWQIEWTSEGHFLGSGPVVGLSAAQLRPGSHLIEAEATNSQGVSGSATVTIVIDGAPAIEVTSPAAGVPVLPLGSYTFEAVVTDGEEPDLGAQLYWYSNVMGPLGIGATIEVELTAVGPERITAWVTDRAGNHTEVVREFVVNALPEVFITAPADGARIWPDEPIQVVAAARDPGDTLTYHWTLDGAPVAGSGAILPLPGLAPGHHTVGILVRDSHGAEASDSVSFTRLAPPRVTISAPAGYTVALYGESVSFAATATAFDGTDISERLQWRSDLSGPIGHGASFVLSEWPHVGIHQITAHVVDDDGLPTTVAVQVEIHLPPSIWYHRPQDGAIFPAGEPVTLEAYATDPDALPGQGDLSPQIRWSSSRDGALGQGALLSVNLSSGVHQITATVADVHGATASRTATIRILDANMAPQVTILAPAAGAKVGAGDAIAFAASAIDDQSGDVSASLVWTSSISGAIGSGGSFTRALPVGTHLITATASDPQGLQGSAAFSLLVVATLTQTFVSAGPQDGFVLESGEDTGVGGLASTGQLRLGDNLADRQYRSFFSFDTSALPDGAVVRKVTLRANRSGTTGVNPATTHGALSVDVKSGFFGASAALENADFQGAATATGTCLMVPASAQGQWSVGTFDAAGRAAVNLAGTTQVRMQLALDDDDDAANDYLDHYGGESTVASTRPQLVVEYLP
jgi:hypothetical protein